MHARYLFSDVDDADATHEEPGARSVISGVPVRMRVASGDLRRPLSSLLSDELHLPVYSVAALTLQWKCASRTIVTSSAPSCFDNAVVPTRCSPRPPTRRDWRSRN